MLVSISMIARAVVFSLSRFTAIAAFTVRMAQSLAHRYKTAHVVMGLGHQCDMATTDLKLEEQGSLTKPGPIGRLTRLVFGVICLYYVYSLWSLQGEMLTESGSIKPLIWNGLVPGMFLVSYIVNIGFSRAWKKRPAAASALLLASVATYEYLQSGSISTIILAKAIYWWELYLFGHLGLAFAVSAVIATPGCEMRAFHHLYSIFTGTPTKEHYCPVGPLAPIDRWEAGSRNSV